MTSLAKDVANLNRNLKRVAESIIKHRPTSFALRKAPSASVKALKQALNEDRLSKKRLYQRFHRLGIRLVSLSLATKLAIWQEHLCCLVATGHGTKVFGPVKPAIDYSIDEWKKLKADQPMKYRVVNADLILAIQNRSLRISGINATSAKINTERDYSVRHGETGKKYQQAEALADQNALLLSLVEITLGWKLIKNEHFFMAHFRTLKKPTRLDVQLRNVIYRLNDYIVYRPKIESYFIHQDFNN